MVNYISQIKTLYIHQLNAILCDFVALNIDKMKVNPC